MDQADEPADPRRSVLLYTQTGCADSARIRSWLAEHGVAFVERNVTGNPAVAQELAATGVFATPLLVVKGAKVLGFRPRELADALAIGATREGSPSVGHRASVG